jgi:hypothetical protein
MPEFTVGAAFEILPGDSFDILERFAGFFSDLSEQATALADQFRAIGEGAFSGLIAATERVQDVLTEQVASVDRLTASYDRLTAAAERYDTAAGVGDVESAGAGSARRRAAPDVVPLPGGRGAPSRGGFDEEEPIRPSEEAPSRRRPGVGREGSSGPHGRASITESGIGGHAVMDIGLGTLIAGWAGFKSEESAMEEQKNITETLAGVNVTPDDPKFKEDYDRLHQMLYDKTKGTKYSNLAASKIMLDSLPTLGLSGDASVDAATNTPVFQTALNAGELSAFRGQGEPGAEAKASFQFAHLTGEFEPDKMAKLIDMVNAIAFRTGTSIAKQESIMKYAAPIGLLAGLPVQETVGMVGAAENRLGDTSTAGTGFSAWILGETKWKGETAHGLSARQHASAKAAERDLESAIKLEPEKAQREHAASKTKAALNAHDQALVAVGIRDAAGNFMPRVRDEAGNFSERLAQPLYAEYAAHHTKDQTQRLMTAIGETRGERFAQPFTTAEGIAREHQQMQSYKDAPTVAKELETLQNLPIQQFEQMLSNLANTGNILATETLGPLNTAFKTMNGLLIGFNDYLTHHQTAAAVIGDSGLGVAGLGVAAATVAVGRFIWNNTGGQVVRGGKWLMSRGAPTAAEAAAEGIGVGSEAAAGAGIGESSLIAGGLLGPLGLLGGGLLAGGAAAGAMNAPMVDEFGRVIGSWGNKDESKNPAAAMPFRAGPRPENLPSASAHQGPINVTVNLGGVVNNGVGDDGTFRNLVSRLQSALTEGIKSALEHATSSAGGTSQSPYVYPGGL